MKTYLFDSLARFKRFSESLDVATTLSNKTWVVFNDSGERELYIFKTDGKVYITANGIGYQGTWEWLSANKSLIIHKADTVFMLHPEIVEECVLVLTLDGTKDCVFLIEDQNRQSFAPKTLAQLQNHFEEKERKVLEAERREKERAAALLAEKKRKEEQAKLAAFIAAEKKRKEEKEEQKKKEEFELKVKAARIKNKIEYPWVLLITMESLVFYLLGAFSFKFFIDIFNVVSEYITIPLFILLLILILVFTIIRARKNIKAGIAKYKAEHPNAPANKYL